MKRCKSGHLHPGALTARECDAQLMARYREDRIARPAQYQPIEPTIPSDLPKWLGAPGKDLTGQVRSN